MFTVTNSGTGKILIKPAANVVLEGTDGFIVVDSNNAIIETEKTVHTDSDGVVDYILLTIKDKFFNGTVNVYVNEKTTLKTNTYNEKQKQFGCYPDQSQSELSGYVLISSSNTITNEPTYFGVSSSVYLADSTDPDDYEFAYVDGRNNSYREQEFTYYLPAGSYTIRILNDAHDLSSILKNYSDDRCKYGTCKLVYAKTGKVKQTWWWNDDVRFFGFTISTPGLYKIVCYSQGTTSYDGDSDCDGWMAFHLYKN